MNMRETARVLAAAIAVAGFAAAATTAHADIKCRQTAAKESSKLTQAIAKTLQKCEQSVHDGKLTGPCSADAKTQESITKAKTKFIDKFVDTCGSSTGEFPFGRCPNETGNTGSQCGNILITDKDNAAACIACLAEHNGKELVSRVLYGSLANPMDNKDLSKCQKTVGQETLKFYLAASKILAKCQDALLKGKVTSCPDAKTVTDLDKAEQKKVDKLTKACCGPDGVCGGATCQTGRPSALGDACEANQDCGRCNGGTTPEAPCKANGQCQSNPGRCSSAPGTCVGGSNPGVSCLVPATCLMGGTCNRPSGNCIGGTTPGAVCTFDSDCPSIAAGTCDAGTCGGVDDFAPTTQIGLPVPCPGITQGGAPIIQTGVTGLSLIACVDTQASDRAKCQDAVGAPFGYDGSLPANCVDATTECSTTGTQTVTVSINAGGTALGGISISLGYQDVSLPGTSDDSVARVTNIQAGQSQVNDTNDALIYSSVNLGGFADGQLFSVSFDVCTSATVTAADFGCVVRSASDINGVELIDGISCSVTVP